MNSHLNPYSNQGRRGLSNGALSPDWQGLAPYATRLAIQQGAKRVFIDPLAQVMSMKITVELDDATATIERRIINGRVTGLKRHEGCKVTIIVHKPDRL